MTLRHCVREAQNGNHEATLFLLGQFSPLIKKQVKKYNGYYQSVEEAISTAHAAACRCIFEFDLTKPGNVERQMMACIHNTFEREGYHKEKYDQRIQKNIIHNAEVTDLPVDCMAPLSQCPEYRCIEKDIHRLIQEALDDLSEKERHFIILHFFNGHSYRKIGRIYHHARSLFSNVQQLRLSAGMPGQLQGFRSWRRCGRGIRCQRHSVCFCSGRWSGRER